MIFKTIYENRPSTNWGMKMTYQLFVTTDTVGVQVVHIGLLQNSSLRAILFNL